MSGHRELIHTDLALENCERFKKDNVEVSGVVIEKSKRISGKVMVTRVIIENEHGAMVMKKPIGTYITIESPHIITNNALFNKKIAALLTEMLADLLKKYKVKKILVVGLGNRMITADSLGPLVADEIMVMNSNEKTRLYSISPGVLAQSGMESAENVKGIVSVIKPDAVIAVDALAARGTKRLNKSIQLSDSGIHPGSGVMNNRKEISYDTLSVPVIAVGIPTVINAATIICDSLDSMMQALSEQERDYLVDEIVTDELEKMFVTPDNINENVDTLSQTIAEGINGLLEMEMV